MSALGGSQPGPAAEHDFAAAAAGSEAHAAGPDTERPRERLRVIDLLRQYTPQYLQRYAAQAVPQVQSVLGKLALCRTAALGGHVYECPRCAHRCAIYNSCIDRHCPLCSGGRRADWLDKTAELLLPSIDYFQIVFTLPEQLWPLMAGNRRVTYALLFRAAWEALREVLREQLGCEPAALMVLHTWNQRLEHFPHLHALVPGGGPSADGLQWLRSRHPQQQRRQKPYLVDNQLLGERFRHKFVAGLTRLHRTGKLRLDAEWSRLADPAAFAAWVQTFSGGAWVVFIEPPPTENADPEHVLKYLARYMTGGPISDRRLIAHRDDHVTFWARSHDKHSGNQSEPYTLSGAEFTQRWALHILPKGFVKSRCYGGFSCRNRKAYLRRCRGLLESQGPDPGAVAARSDGCPDEIKPSPACPRCKMPMQSVAFVARPSWGRVFEGPHRPCWYNPFGLAITLSSLAPHRPVPDG